MQTLLISDLRPAYKKVNFISNFDLVGRLILFYRVHGCEIFLISTSNGLFAISKDDVIGSDWNDRVSDILLKKNISPAIYVFEDDNIDKFFQLSVYHKKPVVVLSSNNIPLGVLYYENVMAFLNGYSMPTKVSGISTPFGVFFSNGIAKGGLSDIKLFLTGSLFSIFAILIFLTGDFFFEATNNLFGATENSATSTLAIILPLAFFLILIKFTRLSKLHGAEHKVAHAIESGDILSIYSVNSYSRIHKRCGTNLLILVLLLQIMIIYLNPILAIVIALFIWRFLGNKVQYYITTTEPEEKDLMNAILAGKDFMKNYYNTTISKVRLDPLKKICNLGIFQILGGYFFTILILNFLAWGLLWFGILPKDYYQLFRLFL
jgi:hypothetical protein